MLSTNCMHSNRSLLDFILKLHFARVGSSRTHFLHSEISYFMSKQSIGSLLHQLKALQLGLCQQMFPARAIYDFCKISFIVGTVVQRTLSSSSTTPCGNKESKLISQKHNLNYPIESSVPYRNEVNILSAHTISHARWHNWKLFQCENVQSHRWLSWKWSSSLFQRKDERSVLHLAVRNANTNRSCRTINCRLAYGFSSSRTSKSWDISGGNLTHSNAFAFCIHLVRSSGNKSIKCADGAMRRHRTLSVPFMIKHSWQQWLGNNNGKSASFQMISNALWFGWTVKGFFICEFQNY